MLHQGNVFVFVLEAVDFVLDGFALYKIRQIFFPHPDLENDSKNKEQNDEREIQIDLISATFQSIFKEPFRIFCENWNSFGKWPMGIDKERMNT